MSDVTESYETLLDFLAILGIFVHYELFSEVLYVTNFSQIVCLINTHILKC